MYGTCSSRGAQAVSDLGAISIDYQNQDFVEEIRRLTVQGVDAQADFEGCKRRKSLQCSWVPSETGLPSRLVTPQSDEGGSSHRRSGLEQGPAFACGFAPAPVFVRPGAGDEDRGGGGGARAPSLF